MNLKAITIPSSLDPFSQSYLLLANLLANNIQISQIVSVKNLLMSIDLGHDPQKAAIWILKKTSDTVSEGDLPEVRIVPAGMTPKIGRDTDHSSFLQKFAIEVSTGKIDASDPRGMFLLQLQLAAAWASWQPLFGELTWPDDDPDHNFVHLAQATEASQSIELKDANRAIRGWAQVWQVQVDIWLATKTLQSLNMI